MSTSLRTSPAGVPLREPKSRRIPSPPGWPGWVEEPASKRLRLPRSTATSSDNPRLRAVAFTPPSAPRREAVREPIGGWTGVPFGGDRPQGPRHHWPFHQPAFQCKEGEQTLRSFGENQEETFDVQPDPPRSERRGRRPSRSCVERRPQIRLGGPSPTPRKRPSRRRWKYQSPQSVHTACPRPAIRLSAPSL